MKRIVLVPALLFSLLGLTGVSALGAADEPVERKPSVLGPGDQVHVRATNAEGFPDTTVRLDEDGYITLPFAGRMMAAGRSMAELERMVQRSLERYFNYAEVSIAPGEVHSRPVSIVGAVNNPGIHQIEGRKTLLDILSLGGGVRNDAGYVLALARRLEQGPVPLPGAQADPTGRFSVAKVNLKALLDNVDPQSNIEVQPGDIITVPRGELVYVLGEVRKPGGFVLNQNDSMSVIQAISFAEGALASGSLAHARLLKRDPSTGTRLERPLNVTKILAGAAPDVPMGPDDVLYIPTNRARNIALRTLDAAIFTGSGIIIYRR